MEYPLTNIHPDAKLAKGVKVEPFSSIYENVEIGEGTWVGPNVTIMPGARIGKNCKIYPGAVISAAPQDLKFEGEDTLTIIGDNTTIRECVTVHKGTNDRMQTVVGNNCLLMAYVHVAHDCIIGDKCIIANAVQIAGHVIVGEQAIIGGTSAVHQFVHIGAHCMISGASAVTKDVPPYCTAGKNPLSYHGLNLIGLRRRGFSSDTMEHIKEIYRHLYSKGINLSLAISNIEEQLPDSKEKEVIVSFLKSSKRGIIRSYVPSNTSEDTD